MRGARAGKLVGAWVAAYVALVAGALAAAPAVGWSRMNALLVAGAVAAVVGVALWRPVSAMPPRHEQAGGAPGWLALAEDPEGRGVRTAVGAGLFLLAMALWATAYVEWSVSA